MITGLMLTEVVTGTSKVVMVLAVVVLALSAGRRGHIAKDCYLQGAADRYGCNGGH